MEYLQDIAICGSLAIGGYFASLAGLGLVQNFISERIESEEELERVVHEESEKLGINPKSIIANFISKEGEDYQRIRGARATVKGYDIVKDEIVSSSEIDNENVMGIGIMDIKEGWGANRGAVRHELYHIKNHLPLSDKRFVRLLKWFYQEPAAEIYAVTGIEI